VNTIDLGGVGSFVIGRIGLHYDRSSQTIRIIQLPSIESAYGGSQVKFLPILIITAYCGFLFWLSAGPVSLPKPLRFEGVDKIAHVCLYGVLAGLVFYGLRKSGKSWTPKALFCLPVFFAALYGASDELHQYFIRSRSCDIVDWLADITGAVLVTAVLDLVFRPYNTQDTISGSEK
jgi:VanZ family protein